MTTWRTVLAWEVEPEWVEVFFPSNGRKLAVDFSRGLYHNMPGTNENEPDRLVRRSNGQWWFLNKGMDRWKHVASYEGGRDHEDTLERAYQTWLRTKDQEPI